MKYRSTRKKKNSKSFLINNVIHYMKRVKNGNKRKPTSCLLKVWLIKRDSLSTYNSIFKKLHLKDQEFFRRYLRMNTEVYEVKF